MADINETVAEVLRLDAAATPGPWTDLGTQDREVWCCAMDDPHETECVCQDPEGDDRPQDRTLIAYYRTAAPALAREVQRLQGEVERLRPRPSFCLDCLYDLPDGSECCPECGARLPEECSDNHQDRFRAGQEAMWERAAAVAARDADGACNCGRPICQPDCARVRLLDLADAIRALEVER